MRESLVFHADFIDHLPDNLKTEWAMYCINYGLYDIEPEFKDPLVSELWRKIKQRIDSDAGAYSEKIKNQKIWKAKNHVKEGRATKEEIDMLNSLGVLGSPKNFGKSQKVPLYSRREYEYDSDSEYDSKYEYENEYESDSEHEYDNDVAGAPDSSSSSLSLYSNQIFTIMSEAGLPCCKNNAVTFMQTDFKNAMSYLHNTPEYQHIHSDDVIGAVNNYVQVLSDNNCYLKGKMNFFSLVKSKIFYNLLPSNFDINNFLDYKKKGEEAPEKKKKVYDGYNPCPDCGHYKLVTVDDKGNAVCDHCGRKVTFDEIMAMPPVTGLPHIEE